jgi:hypothetical protein
MTRKSGLIQYEPATSLADVYKTLSPEPLMTSPEIEAFYRGGINDVRGGDKVDQMALGLGRSWRANFYKAFLGGHPGVGKSTEMTRLVEQVRGQFRAIRFQVTKDLDPGSFKPFDVLLLMMIRAVEETAKLVSEGGAGKSLPEGLLQQVIEWFAREETTLTRSVKTGVEGSAGIGPPANSLLHKVIGLFATVKGEIKYAADRSKEIIEYRLKRVSDLIDLVNKLLNECNHVLREATNCEWLFIGEEFDKLGIPVSLVEDFFLNYANIFGDIQAHVIFTIPIVLVYSERATQLPCPVERRHILPDTPVFDRDHKECKEGRAALREILVARVSPKLFGPSQMNRFIVASGGNQRDLFTMVSQAADFSLLQHPVREKIGKAEADRAINQLRTDYTRKLGVGPYDPAQLTYAQKADRLVAVYKRDPGHDIPDPVLYSLLNARAVQEFNGERWFGVHPLVVDVLKRQGKLEADVDGKVPGGTESS